MQSPYSTSGQKFGARLVELIELREMKQTDLADYLKVTKTTVSRYCRGRIPDAATLDRLAGLFRVTVDYLLGRTDDPQGKLVEQPATPNGSAQAVVIEMMSHDNPARDLLVFLRGKKLTDDDVEAVKDLLEARRLRREREEREKSQP